MLDRLLPCVSCITCVVRLLLRATRKIDDARYGSVVPSCLKLEVDGSTGADRTVRVNVMKLNPA